MKKIILTVALIITSMNIAHAGTRYYYGGDGSSQGWSTSAGSTTYHYGGDGSSLGWSSRTGSSTYYYGGDGSSLGWSNGFWNL